MWVNADLDGFRQTARKEVFGRHGLGEGTQLLITMCRLAPVKGLEMAVETLAGLLPTHPRARLMICGGDRVVPGFGSYQAALLKRAQELGIADKVIFPGNLDIHVVKRYLAAADVHLAPSLVDTFNYGVIEAGLAGTPSLVSKGVGAGPWMLDARAGQVVADRNAADWANAAARLLDKPPSMDERRAAAAHLARELHPAKVSAELAQMLARVAGMQA